MTYKSGSFNSVTDGAKTLIALIEADLTANGWTKVETDLVSGTYTWQVWKSPAASNVIATDFHIALGWLTANTNNFVYTIFRAWDATNNVATGFPPWRPDGLMCSYNASNEVNQTAGPYTGVTRPLPDGTNGTIYDVQYNNTSGNHNGTGTNGTIPPTFSPSTLTWTGVVNATATIYAGIQAATIVSGGSGYIDPPTIAFSGGGATVQATATCTVSGGVINSVTITNAGTNYGYTSQPTITITPTNGGSGASLEIRGTSTGSRADWRPVLIFTANGGYTGGYQVTDVVLNKSMNSANGYWSGSAWTVNARIPAGFMFSGTTLGSSTTDYLYSVDINRLYFSLRANGTTWLTSFYLGVYDSFMSVADDPYPICGCFLGGLPGTMNNNMDIWSGYGFSGTEPKFTGAPTYSFSARQMTYISAVNLPWSITSSGSNLQYLLVPLTYNEGYSGRRIPVRATLMGRGSPGGSNINSTFIRGFLRDVFLCTTGTATAWQDEMQWQIGVTNYAAVRMSNGDGIYALKV